MSSSHIRLYGSTALANRSASVGIQPGPQSRARPTLSPSTSFMAMTHSIMWCMPRSVITPESMAPWSGLAVGVP